MTIRTRFAPSPTGNVHIGNIRTAIFAWLFARHNAGQFLLRVEDTDKDRSTPEAVQTVLSALDWLGLDYDEEPLFQSTRITAHLEAAELLMAKGLAYKQDKGGLGQGDCIVFRMPDKPIIFQDEVRGALRKEATDMDDFVLVRSNGTPVFHLANVVDDIHMGITHVIRGDDHIENTYRHVALYSALDADLPHFAHLPMIINEQGKPYSKRDGAAYVGEYRTANYLPAALFNYLALLGWSPGDDREVMTYAEMIATFELSRVQTSAAKIDLKKLDWMNGVYMRNLPQQDLVAGCRKVLEEQSLWNNNHSLEYLEQVVALMGERLHFFADIASQGAYFFTENYEYEEKAVRKRLQKENVPELLAKLTQRFGSLSQFNATTSEAALREVAEENEVGAGKLIHPLRVAVSGSSAGPSLFEMLELLGLERVQARIVNAISRFCGESQ